MRKQRVVLYHHAQTTFIGRHVGDIDVTDGNATGGGLHESGDRSQHGGFTRTGGANQRQHFAGGDSQRQGFQHFGAAIRHADAVELNTRRPGDVLAVIPRLGAGREGRRHRQRHSVTLCQREISADRLLTTSFQSGAQMSTPFSAACDCLKLSSVGVTSLRTGMP